VAGACRRRRRWPDLGLGGAVGGPVVDPVEVAFRIGNVLVGVALEAEAAPDAGATPVAASPVA